MPPFPTLPLGSGGLGTASDTGTPCDPHLQGVGWKFMSGLSLKVSGIVQALCVGKAEREPAPEPGLEDASPENCRGRGAGSAHRAAPGRQRALPRPPSECGHTVHPV